MAKDTLNVIGASNHSLEERSKLDYYGTDPKSTKALLEVEDFSDFIWEPCAGRHMMVDVLKAAGYDVMATDIADYGFGDEKIDFLSLRGQRDLALDIVTNPPYAFAIEFVEKALEIVQPGRKVAMFLHLLFLEGAKRYERLFKENPPKTVYVFTNRQVYDKNDDFAKGSAVAYAWFGWVKGWKGNPEIKWVSTK